ncbi:MAG: nucleoside triphosphate pyrophosphohydrolase [Coriobacteriales bacterium]|nr:nucleoside triphosphate pyrophosphohydrolase [Coriobacteriales bacterium]
MTDPTSERPTTGERFERFKATIAALRAPDGCPWDIEQTHTSIGHNMVEEAHEVLDAIERGDVADMREELGDVLLQVVLHAQIASEAGEFSLDDVLDDIDNKIVRRHPHVFGDEAAFAAARFTPEHLAQIEAARTSGAVLDLWDQIKLQEKRLKAERLATSTSAPSLLDGVPHSLPALMQAQDISRKAAAVGFEWPDVQSVWEQVYSEVEEFKEAEPGSTHAEEEFGDVLFSLVNVARTQGIDAESALRVSCRKFRRRWAIMEQNAELRQKALQDLSTTDLEALWQLAKQQERSTKGSAL